MRLRATPTLIGALLAGAALLTGCGGSSPSSKPTAAAAPAAKTHKVEFGEYFYRPKTITIRVGDSVSFVNVGKIEHTVADSSASGAIRSTLIKPRPLAHGASQTVTFTKTGTVHYLCTFHPSLMKGIVIVR